MIRALFIALAVGLAAPALADEAPRLEAEIAGKTVRFAAVKVDVDARIDGDLASVKLVQTFRNPSAGPVNARYVFPLPPDAAVHALVMRVGGRVIEGQIKKKAAAQATFAAAKKAGKAAALTEQHRPNVFTQQIANLMPGAPVVVELGYAHPVARRDGRYTFHVPTVVGPRYTRPSAAADPGWAPPPTPPVVAGGAPDEARVGVTVQLDAGLPVQWIDSPSHAIDVSRIGASGRRITLAPSAPRVRDDQDFELRYRLSPEADAAFGLRAWREPGRDGVFSLLIEPPRRAPAAQLTPREVVFVLDCSGSMAGVPLDASKQLVRHMLRGLRPNDLFRIVRFSASAHEMGPPQPATQANVEAGVRWLDGLRGGGGTEMSTGINAALSPPPVPGALRTVVFLTDGYIGADARTLALIDSQLGDARLFSFGVGTAVNRALLEALAARGRGVARMVRPDEDVAHAAEQFAARLAAPYLTDLRIDWGDAPVHTLTPARLPDLFLGERLRVMGAYSKPGRYSVVVHGTRAGRAVQRRLEVVLPAAAPEAEALPIVWARSRVADLMRAWHTGQTSSVEAEVTRLGLSHRLVTRWTAFVAVDRVVQNPGGHAPTAEVPVAPVRDTTPAFVGSGAPEPAFWAAVLLMALGLGWSLRRRPVSR